MVSRAGSKVLSLKATMGQKSPDILRIIRAFLSDERIHSSIYSPTKGVSTLEVRRADDLARFLSLVRPMIKQRQTVTAKAYLEGRINGNRLLEVFDEEYRLHARKSNPLFHLGPRFPLTRFEAVEFAQANTAQARLRANRKFFLSRMRARVGSLPRVFDVKDIQRVIGVSKTRAQKLARMMEGEHFVSCRYEKVPPRFHKLVCERLPESMNEALVDEGHLTVRRFESKQLP